MDNTEFQMWRRQGGILRHAQPGQRINPAQAPSPLTLLEKNQMRRRFDANRGVVVISSGTSSQIRELSHNHGSYRIELRMLIALAHLRQSEDRGKVRGLDQKLPTRFVQRRMVRSIAIRG